MSTRKKNKPNTAVEKHFDQDRELALAQLFSRNIGQDIFLLISGFPFMIIGQINAVHGDFLHVLVETSNSTEVEGETIRIHIADIFVFFIENEHPEE